MRPAPTTWKAGAYDPAVRQRAGGQGSPRIHFRGKLDSLQALVVLDQVQIAEGGCPKLVDDLGNILGVLREMMRCDVLDEAFKNETIIGLTHAELRERSHNPQKFASKIEYELKKHLAIRLDRKTIQTWSRWTKSWFRP